MTLQSAIGPAFPVAAWSGGSSGKERPDEGLGRTKMERQWWTMNRKKGGLKTDQRRAPVSTAPFPELASESAAISWAEINPTEVLGRRRSRCWSCMARGGRRRRRCRPWKNGGAWGGREGRPSPIQADSSRGKCAVSAPSVGERMVVVGRKGRETSPSQPIPSIKWSQSLRGR